jgi:hypothetical protein
MTTNAPNSPLFPAPSPKATPSQVASTVGSYMKAIVCILFWAIVGAAAAGATYVALRAIYWGVQIAVQPLH